MKSLLLFGALALSLAANVWLVSTRQPSSSSSVPPPEKTAAAKSNRPPTTAAANAVTWDSLHKGNDLPALVAGLRAAGFPPDLVRRIVVAQLNEQFAARRKRIFDNSTMPFWKPSAPNAEQSLALRTVNDEIRATLVSLEIDPDSAETKANRLQRYGNISPGKIYSLDKIILDYSDLINQLYSTNSPAQGPAVDAQRKLLEAEQRKDMAALLTPAELEEYNLRNSNASHVARSAVQNMNVSEDEYRAIFRAVQAKEQAHPIVYGVQTADMLDAQAAASREMLSRFRSTLGDERFLKYLNNPYSEFRDIANFASNNPGLSVDQIVGLLDAQGSLNSAMIRANRKPGQTNEDWQLAVAKVAAEYRAQIAAQIGADRLDAFVKGNYGQLSMFLKREAPPPKN